MSRIRTLIATEGPASQAVLQAICRRHGANARVLTATGKPRLLRDFHAMFLSQPPADAYVVAPDLHPEEDCVAEAARWRKVISTKFPQARLCLVIWETESWLLADPGALKEGLGITLHVSDPEARHGPKPSERLEDACKKARKLLRGAAFDKAADGVRVVEAMDLDAARKRSASLDRFLSLVK